MNVNFSQQINDKVLAIIWRLSGLPFWRMILILSGCIFLLVAIFIILIKIVRGSDKTFVVSDGASMANTINASIYGLILAFFVVAMYNDSQKVQDSISQETDSLVAILQNSQTFDNAPQIRTEVQNYIRVVVDQEWPLMREGKMDEAWALAMTAINPLYKVIQEVKPQGTVQENFYAALPGVLHDLDAAHRERLVQADAHLPAQFWRIINVMTILAVFLLVYVNPWKGVMTLLPILIPCIVISFSLGLLITFHYPFIGPFAISNKDYFKGNLDFSDSANAMARVPSTSHPLKQNFQKR